MNVTAEPAPITINFQPPAGTKLGAIMNDIRTWLDSEKIEPLDFKQVAASDRIGFEIRFREQSEADRFQRAF